MEPDGQHPHSNDGLVKVTFDLPEKDGTFATESLWAEPIGDDLYLLRNVPFYLRGFSEQDTVKAEEHEGRLVVRSIVERGGHSTYRIFLPEQTTEAQFSNNWVALWQPPQAKLPGRAAHGCRSTLGGFSGCRRILCLKLLGFLHMYRPGIWVWF
jgi:hypothetical protein